MAHHRKRRKPNVYQHMDKFSLRVEVGDEQDLGDLSKIQEM